MKSPCQRLLSACVLSIIVLLAHCATRDNTSGRRNNPYDPAGSDFTRNEGPENITITAGTWSNYDFDRETGTLKLVCDADDPNQEYDTLRWTMLAGASGEQLDTVRHAGDGVFDIDGVLKKQPVFFRVIVADRADNTSDTAGVITAPSATPPRPPELTDIRNSAQSVMIEFDTVYEADGYNLYRSDSLYGAYKRISGSPSKSRYYSRMEFADYLGDMRNADKYREHYYFVTAFNHHGECRSRDTLSGRLYYSYLPVPSINSASRGDYATHISITWRASSADPSPETYAIYRAVGSSSSPFQKIASAPHSNALLMFSYNDSVKDASRYFYRIAAFDSIGRGSGPSDVTYGWLKSIGAPDGIKASTDDYVAYIEISWLPEAHAHSYKIYRSFTRAGPAVLIDSVDTTYYRDSTADSLSVYYYSISSVDSTGKEGVRSATTPGRLDKPDAPAGITFNVTLNSIELQWSPVEHATSYYIERSTSSYYNGDIVANAITDTSWIDTNVSVNQPYYYNIGSNCIRGRGSVSARTYSATIHIPDIQAFDYDDCIRIAWTESDICGSRFIERSIDDSSSWRRAGQVDDSSAFYHDSTARYRPSWYRLLIIDTNGDSARSDAIYHVRKPAEPRNFRVEETVDSAILHWAPSDGADGYLVYCRNLATIDSAADTSFIITNTQIRRQYEVAAYNEGGRSSYTEALTAGVLRAPGTPVEATGKSYATHVHMSWQPDRSQSFPQGYYVFRSPAPNGPFHAVDTIADTVYRDTVEDADVRYYRIVAFNDAGPSQPTNPLILQRELPDPPGGLSASTNTYGTHVLITWTPSSEFSSYRVYRSENGTNKTLLAEVDTSVYHDSAASPGRAYYYFISGLTEISESRKTTRASGSRLGAPANVAARGSQQHIAVSWSPVQGATRYAVYRTTEPGGTFEAIDTAQFELYADTVTDAAMYYYKISSINQNESILSESSGGARRKIPDTPIHLSASDGTAPDTILLRWGASAGATGYRIYRDSSSLFDTPVFRGETDTTAFDDTVSDPSVWYYRIKAYNPIGESVLGTIDSGFIRTDTPPNPPQSPAASDSIDTHIRLSWQPPAEGPGVIGYVVYRAAHRDSAYAVLDTLAGFGFAYDDYVARSFPAWYWYTVRGMNAAGLSEPSAAVQGTRR